MSTRTPKTIKSGHVHLIHDGALVSLGPGDVIPDWAVDLVTNPALFVGEEQSDITDHDPQSQPAGAPATDNTPTPTKEPSQAELKQQARDLGIPASGSKKDLAARIAEKHAELAVTLAQNEPAGSPAGDGEDADREALEERAKELGIEFDDETTEVELGALIEDATQE